MTVAPTIDASVAPGAEPAAPSTTPMQVVYGLYALGFIFPLTWIIGLIVAYVHLSEVRGTWLESHARWAIATVWLGVALCLLWIVPAILLTVVLAISLIGIPLILVVWLFPLIWAIYRIARGWLALLERKPVAGTFV